MNHRKYGTVKFIKIDNQEMHDGLTGKVIDIQGKQAHVDKDFFVRKGTHAFHLNNLRTDLDRATIIEHTKHHANLRSDKDLDPAERIQQHASVLQKVGITDLSTLGKLSIPSGNVTPRAGVLIPPSSSNVLDDIIGQKTTFHSAYRIILESTGASRLEKMGGTTYFLKALNLMKVRAQTSTLMYGYKPYPSHMQHVPAQTSTLTYGYKPYTSHMQHVPAQTPTLPYSYKPNPSLMQHVRAKTAICANPLTSMDLLEIPVAYWAAEEIVIPDNTKIVLLQPHQYLIMIADKITIGNNVDITWEMVDKEIKKQPTQKNNLDPPPTATSMSGTNGRNGVHGYSDRSGRGSDGDDGPEIEVWTLDINKLPLIYIAGQKGCQGGKGQNGQDGQDGAKGRSWIPKLGGASCKSGPGNGGKGGDGGNGAKGAQGGDGGHGGCFSVFALDDALLAIGQVGYYIDATGGDGGDGGEGGDGGKRGNGGKAGNNRKRYGPCPTRFGQNGASGRKGTDGPKGDNGGVGDHFEENAQKFIPITTDMFHEAYSKPAILDLSADTAHAGDAVTAIGLRFTNTDKVFVDGVEASTEMVSDTQLNFMVPQTTGGRQKAVVIKQQDGTLSNRATLHIVPKLLYAAQNGNKSTDRPVVRFAPGSNVTLVGTGFAPDATVRVENAYVSGADVQYINPTKLTFKLIRPGSIPENHDGEPVNVRIILSKGSESNAITIILDTYVIAVFGDSIQWGQGLREDLKFHSLVENRIKATNGDMGVYKTVLAHSGASIGKNKKKQLPPVNGEVPTDYPTILQQIDAYPHDPAAVDLVLLNGGINDITVEEIVSPIATSNLSKEVQEHCYTDMMVLLEKVEEQFPNARIIVTGYYSIITDDSDLSLLFLLLSGLGMIVGGPAGAIVGGVISATQKEVMVSRSNTFATEANQKLQKAVNDINATFTDGTKVYFARPKFSSRNAIFAPDTWLWGMDKDFSPEDIQQIGGVAPIRERVCQSVEASEPSRTNLCKCKIASIGHPNVAGAKEYARVILELGGI